MQDPRGVFPTAPVGLQVQVPQDAEESASFKSKSPLSKVKNKAKRLKDKFRKVTSPSTPSAPNFDDLHPQPSTDQGPNSGFPSHPVDQRGGFSSGADLHGDDEEFTAEEEDQSQSDELRSLDAAAKPEELPVHGGSPAPAVDDFTGAYAKPSGGTQERSPISPFKNDGPPGTLQAAPTEYHYLPEDDQILADSGHGSSHGAAKPAAEDTLPREPESFVESPTNSTQRDAAPANHTHKSHEDTASIMPIDHELETTPSDGIGNPLTVPSEAYSMHKGSQISSRGMPSPPAASGMMDSRHSSSSEISDHGLSDQMSPTERDMNVPYPNDLVKPNPEFGRSSSPMQRKIAVINEDIPAETLADTGLSPGGYASPQGLTNESVPEHAPLAFDGDELDSRGFMDRASPAKEVRGPDSNVVDHTVASKVIPEAGIALAEEKVSERSPFSSPDEEEPVSLTSPVDENVEEGHEPPVPASAVETRERNYPVSTSPADSPHSAEKARETDEVKGGLSMLRVPPSHKPTSDVQSLTDSSLKTKDIDSSGLEGEMATASYAAPVHDDASDLPRKHNDSDAMFLDSARDNNSGQLLGSYAAPKDIDESDAGAENYTAPHYKDREAAKMEEEQRGKLSGDILNDPKKVEDTPNAKEAAFDEPQNVSGAFSEHDEVSRDGQKADTYDATSPHDHENLRDLPDEKEDEYYDPNNVDDNQFQEGFARGTEEAEQEPSDGTFTGATIGTLTGLTGAVASKLGLASAKSPAPPADDKEESDSRAAGERTVDERVEDAPNFTQEDDRTAGIVSEEGVGSKDENMAFTSPDEHLTEPAIQHEKDSQPKGGLFQGLKNVVSTRLGYGEVSPKSAASDPSHEKENVASSAPDEYMASTVPDEHLTEPAIRQEEDNQPKGGVSRDLEDVVSGSKEEKMASSFPDEHEQLASTVPDEHLTQPAIRNEDSQPKGGLFQGLKNVVSTRLGYGEMSPKSAASDPSHEEENLPSSTADEYTASTDPDEHEQLASTVSDEHEHLASAVPDEHLTQPAVRQEDSQPKGGLSRDLEDVVSGGKEEKMPSSFPDEHEQLASTVPDKHLTEPAAIQQEKDNQPRGGMFQDLKNEISSKLGYGELSPRDFASDPSRDVTYDEERPSTSPSKEEAPPPTFTEDEHDPNNSAGQQQTGGALQGLKNMVASKLMFGGMPQEHTADHPPRDDGRFDERSPPSPVGDEPPVSSFGGEERTISPAAQESEDKNATSPSSYSPGSYAQKLFNTAAAAKDYLWSPKSTPGKQNEDIDGTKPRNVEGEIPTTNV